MPKVSAHQEKNEDPVLDWVQLHEEMASHPRNVMYEETQKERFMRKVKENPVVPIGCLATLSALLYGLWSFRKGDRKMSQYMMRARVAAQGFTVLALVVGLGIKASKSQE